MINDQYVMMPSSQLSVNVAGAQVRSSLTPTRPMRDMKSTATDSDWDVSNGGFNNSAVLCVQEQSQVGAVTLSCL